MSGGSELGRFLRAKRAQVQPESVGLSEATRRRVPGLRRNEVATLSGISTEYYVRLEQGRDQNPSAQVLQALAGALRLDSAATAHLYRLSRPLPETPRAHEQNVSPMVLRLVASWPVTPALVVDQLGTVLAANTMAALLSTAHRPGTSLPRHAPEIHAHANGISVFDHPDVGTLELHYEKLAVLSATGPCPNSAGQCLIVFEAEPGSVSAHRLATLAAPLEHGVVVG